MPCLEDITSLLNCLRPAVPLLLKSPSTLLEMPLENTYQILSLLYLLINKGLNNQVKTVNDLSLQQL